MYHKHFFFLYMYVNSIFNQVCECRKYKIWFGQRRATRALKCVIIIWVFLRRPIFTLECLQCEHPKHFTLSENGPMFRDFFEENGNHVKRFIVKKATH